MVVDDANAEMELQVGPVDIRAASYEAARLRRVGCQEAGSATEETGDLCGPGGEHRQGEAEEAGTFGDQVGDIVAMVLQIGPDVGGVLHHLDAETLQRLARADARHHQKLRRTKGAGGKDHLAPGVKPRLASAAQEGDAGGAPALEQDAPHLAIGIDGEVRRRRGLQISPGGVVAAAVLLEQLIDADALLDRTVEVVVARKAGLDRGRDESLDRGIAMGEIADMQRPADAVPRRRPRARCPRRA